MNRVIADRARQGQALTAEELDQLATCDILSLGILADEVRRARAGDAVTYVRDAEIRLTSLPASLSETVDLIRSARAASTTLLAGFSLADIIDRDWAPLTDVLTQMKQAGLDAIVEAPVDLLVDPVTALEAARAAGLQVRCLSLRKPLSGPRTDYLMRVRALVERFTEIDAVAPLPREQSIAAPTTGYEDVRAVALARLALPSVRRIQVDWTQYGPKLAQVALTFGANDLDRVPTTDDEALGRRRTSLEDVRRNIAAAGFTAVERT